VLISLTLLNITYIQLSGYKILTNLKVFKCYSASCHPCEPRGTCSLIDYIYTTELSLDLLELILVIRRKILPNALPECIYIAGVLEKICTWVRYYFKVKINENEVNRTFEYRVVLYLFVKICERNVISSFL
jgi:hypothetical protein